MNQMTKRSSKKKKTNSKRSFDSIKLIAVIIISISFGGLSIYFWKFLLDIFKNYLASPLVFFCIVVIVLFLVYLIFIYVTQNWKASAEVIFTNSVGLLGKEKREEKVEAIGAEVKKYFEYQGLFRLANFVLLLFAAVLGSFITIQQNELIEIQNKQVSQQTLLADSERRSSLINLLESTFEQINKELKGNENGELSDQLIAQIAILNSNLRPYFTFEGEDFSKKRRSPERGMILSILANSSISKNSVDKIFRLTKFDFADLRSIIFVNGYFDGAILWNSDFTDSNMKDCSFNDVLAHRTIWRHALIKNTTFKGTDFSESDFSKIIIENSEFNNCKFSKTIFKEIRFINCGFYECNFDGAYVDSQDFLEKIESLNKGIGDLSANYSVSSKTTKVGSSDLFMLQKNK